MKDSKTDLKTDLTNKIFNFDKTAQDYKETPLVLSKQEPGLFDTINKQYPEIWALYKRQKELDWDETEFNFSSAISDFETCDKSVYEVMIKTLAWQYEADSIFSRNIAPLFAPFISSSELWAAWLKVTEIEVLHAATYSEIIRNSFKNPDDVLKEILAVQEAHDRIGTVTKVMTEGAEASHKYALGMIENDQDLYNKFMMMVLALYLGERVQFMASFAITFALGETGLFQPVCKAIQKICQDEFEVHAQLDKVFLQYEFMTERGKQFLKDKKTEINDMITEVIQSEFDWTDYLFSEGRSIAGMNENILKEWVMFCAGDVIRVMGAEVPFDIPEKNPLKYMEHWINIGLIQPSPQEQDIAMYKINNVIRDDEDAEFDIDF